MPLRRTLVHPVRFKLPQCPTVRLHPIIYSSLIPPSYQMNEKKCSIVYLFLIIFSMFLFPCATDLTWELASLPYIPPNHNSALFFPDHVLSHIHNKLSLHRYPGPFSSSRLELLIGPFRTSPLRTVPKSDSSMERKIIQDLSLSCQNM